MVKIGAHRGEVVEDGFWPNVLSRLALLVLGLLALAGGVVLSLMSMTPLSVGLLLVGIAIGLLGLMLVAAAVLPHRWLRPVMDELEKPLRWLGELFWWT